MTAIFSDDTVVELSPDDSTLTEAGILIVDEDPAFQLGLKTFLREYVGFEKVFTARNGKEAIELINREKSIELLTVDFQMPGMDGIELLEHLRENAPRYLGVTMITGFPSEKLKKEFAGLTSSRLLTNHFLSKPVEFEKLEPVILDSYEELKRSQMLTETMTGGEKAPAEMPVDDFNAMARAASNRELTAKFDRIEARLEQNTRALREIGRPNSLTSFFTDVLKILVAAAIAWLAWQSGILSKLSGNEKPEPAAAEMKSIEPVPVVISQPVPTPSTEASATVVIDPPTLPASGEPALENFAKPL